MTAASSVAIVATSKERRRGPRSTRDSRVLLEPSYFDVGTASPGSRKPYLRMIARPGSEPTNSTKPRASFGLPPPAAAACRRPAPGRAERAGSAIDRHVAAAGVRRPARARRSRRRRCPTARTSSSAARSRRRRRAASRRPRRPAFVIACCAARPYGACSGFAIAIFANFGSRRLLELRRRAPPCPSTTRRCGRARRAPWSLVARASRLHDVVDERDVGRGEHVEGRALGDLLGEQARRAEAELDLLAGLPLERGADLPNATARSAAAATRSGSPLRPVRRTRPRAAATRLPHARPTRRARSAACGQARG